ncbi:MAG TPA: hypothetical protein DCZ69_00880 [Syntrophobacteraceae bacterium]|jgi:fructoselysine 3-epimerase|nr:hypothetical protein [Syntrophobacteraceae bacterium]HBD06789.1 hypothetical protein [Syntrophobacteraceae bacterium]HBZ57028.1 hypothetical protein [Syntrophobacteraceae bacterium]
MKFSFNTKIMRFHPLADAMDLIARAGFQAVELMADRPHAFPKDLSAERINALNQCLAGRKLEVSNLNSATVTSLEESHNPSWVDEDWQVREQRIHYTLDCLRLAAAIGVPQVSTQGGGPIPAGSTYWESFRLFVANLHRVLPLARKLGVKLLIEPTPGMLLENSDHLLDLLAELGFSDFLQVSFDIVHFYCAGENPLTAWEKLKDHVSLVRLSDTTDQSPHTHVALGEGMLDLPAFLSAVRQSDFEGYVTIQPEGNEQLADKVAFGAADYLQRAGFMDARSETAA